ncbi:penicillin-binding protein [Bacillus sp. DTU_2020_1000418_1_SI_GHA_SEK_038]|uniref:penicillin-binding protein n=1 Tax=Bacillus sp. DTU_2020_1000418_1_SI_GHA_SEK_038 TaxID=3077585 RepID=UPI0028F0205B|nr:penicillin-binding protein [Bacillus sp. DTU_2020_1000418_1_SI_GHA_SEK_038]WNS77075.1 penicillin-binding protein [Bacillus sp. DTU_2020_1000418_1_SI_GHA_SEK_038]
MIKKQPNINFGAAILFVIFGLLFFVLVYRFISIQVTGEIRGHVLAAEAQQKYENERVIEARRGTIYDRNGEVLATDMNSYKLVAILDEKMTTNEKKPRHVVNPEKTASELAKVIEMNESDIYRLLTKVNPKTNEKPFQVEFGKAGRDLTNQKKREIEELKLPGITFIKDTKRFYPNGVFASHLVGYVEKKEAENNRTETVGMLGLEQSLNDILTGENGKVKYESDLWGYLLSDSEERVTPARNGQDVYLTIDKKIQTFLEDSLNKVENEYKPKKIFAVVADPKTGEILAMGQRPSFHPMTKEGINETWHNEIIENSFEPGSTMKIFTLGAAIEEGVFNQNDTFKSGQYAADNKSRPVRDWNDGRGWGTISYLEGVQRSSNVVFAKLVKEKLGFDTYEKYLTSFGFDRPTGIELPKETGGKIVYNWPLEKITTGFGQGTAITPIQQVQAATAIANDGNMMKPHIISKIVDPNDDEKIVKKTEPEVAGKPISANTAKQVRDILETVVSSPKGTGFRYYNIEGYEVAGKTGTAQIPNPQGGYLTGRQNYVFSFLGMAPKDDPKLVVYVAVQQPEIDIHTSGAIPVADVFNPVMKSSLQYLNIDPAVQTKPNFDLIPNVTDLSPEEAIKQLTSKGMEPIVIGKGNQIIKQLPEAGASLLSKERVIIRTDGNLTIPDMTGWSLRDVMKIAKLGNLKLNTVGSGYVKKQNLKPGALFNEGEYLIVELEPPIDKYSVDEEEPSEDSEEEIIEVKD